MRTLVDQTLSAGDHITSWNGTDDTGRRVPSGLYLYRKYGLWHIGTLQDNYNKTAETEGEPRSITVGELDNKPSYAEQVKTYS